MDEFDYSAEDLNPYPILSMFNPLLDSQDRELLCWQGKKLYRI
jgi:hypothetical protein